MRKKASDVILLRDVVFHISGPNSVEIVDLLYGKENVNEFDIAKKLKITINQARNILYKLAEEGLVGFIRKKDKKNGGWYTYFWTLNVGKALEVLRGRISSELKNFESQLHSKQTKQFYHCENCDIEVSEENALLYNFTCPECGEVFAMKDNKGSVDEIKGKMEELKGKMEKVDFELNEIMKKEEIVRERKRKAEERKKKRKRAAKRKEREMEKAKKIGKKAGRKDRKHVKKTKKGKKKSRKPPARFKRKGKKIGKIKKSSSKKIKFKRSSKSLRLRVRRKKKNKGRAGKLNKKKTARKAGKKGVKKLGRRR